MTVTAVMLFGVSDTVNCKFCQCLCCRLVNRDSAQYTWCVAVFSADVLPPYAASTLKMEAESFSETLGNICQTRQYRNP